MSLGETTSLAALLDRVNAGDHAAWHQLIDATYERLRCQAHAVARRELELTSATSVLHDALADLLAEDLSKFQFASAGRFFALVSRTIRNRLIDRVRRRSASKRGGGMVACSYRTERDDVPMSLREFDLAQLNVVLVELRERDERLWEVVELKFFAQLSNAEIAGVCGRSLSTIERDWRFARAWLQEQMGVAHDTGRAAPRA